MNQPNKYLSKLKDARVLIIGGSAGIGLGVAEAVIEHEGSVIITSSSSERIQRAIDSLKQNHPSAKVEGYPCQLGSSEKLESEVERLFTEIAKNGKLDHVVLTAGDALAVRKLENFTLAEIQQAGMVRFFAPIVVAQHLRTALRDDSTSSYTLTTGGIPEHLMKDWAIVQGYLSGINGLARGLAVDLAPIRVNSVGLGPVETDIWAEAKEAGVYEQIMANFTARMTTQKIGRVEDVVEAYLYCMKDGNVSGSVVHSHGGTLLL